MMKYRCYILLSLVSGAFTKISLRAQSKLAKCKRIFVPTHNSWRRLKSFFRIECLQALLSTCLNSVTPLQCCLSLLLLMYFLS